MRLALLVLLTASACTVADEHHIEAAWSIDRYGDGTAITADGDPGVNLGCPTGWTTVHLVAMDPSAPDTRSVDTFPCDAQQGTSSFLPADSYVAWLEVSDGDKVLATTPPTTTEVTSYDPDLLASIYVDAGYATVAWTPAADTVSIALTGEAEITTTFEADAGAGLIGPLPKGRYHAAASAGNWSATLPDVVIAAPNGLADLGTLAIDAP
jgi:hypothetical protein